MNIENTALLVVDVQQALFRKRMHTYEPERLIYNINQWIDFFHHEHKPVYFFRQTTGKILQEDTSGWEIHQELHQLDSDIIITKYKSSVFEDTNVHTLLQEQHINKILVVGMITQGCVKMACLDGIKLGYEVILPKDSHSNFNRKAKEIIDEWNERFEKEGVKVALTEQFLGRKNK